MDSGLAPRMVKEESNIWLLAFGFRYGICISHSGGIWGPGIRPARFDDQAAIEKCIGHSIEERFTNGAKSPALGRG
jgi:hypothetical protein